MPLYVCRNGRASRRHGGTAALAWVRRAARRYPMPPADKPLVAMLRDLL
jgi:8-oxo-dGTP diphosphatase